MNKANATKGLFLHLCSQTTQIQFERMKKECQFTPPRWISRATLTDILADPSELR